MPGRRQQMPRITAMIFTPALEARYSASISASSTNELSFNQIAAGRPAWAKVISCSISSSRTLRVVSGLNATASISSGSA